MALQDVLDDLAKRLDFILEVTGKSVLDRSTTRTFYYSVHGRFHTSADATGAVDVPPLIMNPGGFSIGLSADSLFTGIAEASARQIVLANEEGPQNLNPLKNWIFTDGAVVVKAGEEGAAYSTFEAVFTGRILKEPTIRKERGIFHVATVLDRMRSDYPVQTFFGQEAAIELFSAGGTKETDQLDASYVTDYDLESFTITYRRFSNPPFQNATTIISKSGSWRIATGLLDTKFYVTVGGVEKNVASYSSTPAFGWVSWAFGYDAEDGKAYASFRKLPFAEDAVDTSVTDSSKTPGAPDANTNGIVLLDPAGGGTEFEHFADVRIYSDYLPPSEALELAVNASEEDEDRLVAAWRMDDNSGTTITDYSPVANNAVGSGTVSWIGSGMGSPAVAGSARGHILGHGFNLPVLTISEVFGQYATPFRTQGVSLPETQTITVDGDQTVVKSRGVPVTYNDGIEWSDELIITKDPLLSEPVTMEHGARTLPTLATDDSALQGVITDIIAGFVSTTDTNIVDSSPEFSEQFPSLYRVGVFIPDSISRTDLMRDILEPLGLNVHQRVDGALRFSQLTSPLTPTPLGTPTLAHPEVDFGNIPSLTSGAFSMWCWFRIDSFARKHPDVTGLGQGTEGGHYLICKAQNANDTATLDWKMFVRDDGRVEVRFKTGITQKKLVLKKLKVEPERWYFVAFRSDVTGSAKPMRFHWMEQGEAELKTYALEDTPVSKTTDTTRNLTVGYAGSAGSEILETKLRGAVSYMGIADAYLTKSRLSSLAFGIEDGTASDLDFYAPFTEGSGATVDNLAGTDGTVNAGTWFPSSKVAVDELDTPGEIQTNRVREPFEIVVRYNKNHAPMVAADISEGVSSSASGGDTFSFNDNFPGSKDTITRSGGGSFITDGIGSGNRLTISGTSGLNKTVLVDTQTAVTASTITLATSSRFGSTESGVATAVLETVTDKDRTALQREWESVRVELSDIGPDSIRKDTVLRDRADARRVLGVFERRTVNRAVYAVPGDRRHMIVEIEDDVWFSADEPGLRARSVGMKVVGKEVDFATGKVELILWGESLEFEDDFGVGDIIATDASAGDVAATSDGDVFRVTGGPRS